MSQGAVLTLLSEIFGLAGRYSDEQIELTKEYVLATFKDNQQSQLLLMLASLTALRQNQSRKSPNEEAVKAKADHPIETRPTKKGMPTTHPDYIPMLHEIINMVTDPTFIQALVKAKPNHKSGNIVLSYVSSVFESPSFVKSKEFRLNGSQVKDLITDAFVTRDRTDQLRIYKTIRNDYLQHRGSNLNSLTKLINEEGDE